MARLAPATKVFVWQGPVLIGTQDWWEIEQLTVDHQSASKGWILTDTSSGRSLAPLPLACPPVTGLMDPSLIDSLPAPVAMACFGDESIVIRGDLRCSEAEVDGIIGGPNWLPSGSIEMCQVGLLSIVGEPVTSLATGGSEEDLGEFDVTGHFSDGESSSCGSIPFGTSGVMPSAPEAWAVRFCRQFFVVTEATKVP